MYDYLVRFASRAAAADSHLVQQHMDRLRALFAADRVIAGIDVWRESQDTIEGTDEFDEPRVRHVYIPGFSLLISLPRLIPALRDDPAVQLVIDRELARARQDGAVIRSAVSASVLQDIRFSPVPAGADYPWGNWR